MDLVIDGSISLVWTENIDIIFNCLTPQLKWRENGSLESNNFMNNKS